MITPLSSLLLEVMRPLTTVIVGGLVTSPVLTLIILPSPSRWLAHRSVQERAS